MGPAIIVFPDCFTALGGNQYVNSSAIGHYADYLTRELIPFVDREFRTLASRDHRGCFGKSSGGYGAIIHGMKYARYWGAIADHSGDAYFDFVYRHDWPQHAERARPSIASPSAARARTTHAPRRNRARGSREGSDDGRVKRFLEAMWGKEKLSLRRRTRDHEPLHGRDLRPRPEGAARLPAAVQSRNRRDDRGALEELAGARSRSTSSNATPTRCARCAASTSTADGATSTTSTTARESCRCAWPRPGLPTPTRSSTTITPTSTTGWT